MELIRTGKIGTEDIAFGNGRFEQILLDGRVVTLRQVHVGTLFLTQSTIIQPSAAAQQSVSGLIPAGARVAGITAKILRSLGTSSGLTSFDVGDSNLSDFWGNSIGITEGTVTSQADFTNADMPIYASAEAVLLTARGGNFDTTGRIEIRSHYFLLTHE